MQLKQWIDIFNALEEWIKVCRKSELEKHTFLYVSEDFSFNSPFQESSGTWDTQSELGSGPSAIPTSRTFGHQGSETVTEAPHTHAHTHKRCSNIVWMTGMWITTKFPYGWPSSSSGCPCCFIRAVFENHWWRERPCVRTGRQQPLTSFQISDEKWLLDSEFSTTRRMTWLSASV